MSDVPPNKVARIEPRKYLLSMDCERKGKQSKHGVWAVGVVFGLQNGTVLESRAFCSKAEPSDFDPETLEWALKAMPEAMARINNEAISNHMRALFDYLMDLQTRYGPFGRKHKDTVHLRFCSDNPAYDMHWISTEFHKMFGDESTTVAEMFDDYCPTDDPTEQERFLLPEERRYVEDCVKRVPHDHYPLNDAMQIYVRQCALEVVAQRRSLPFPMFN
jgi:hypothetical protein